jgi:6-phosphogluconolactonase (cycloisomerase 2 family)
MERTNIVTATGAAAAPHALESLEKRRFLSAAAGPTDEFVYAESNNPQAGQNAVLAFRREASDGSLHPIGAFLTAGTGFGNPIQGLGPDDSDQEVIASPDGRFVFAVNQGSDSIAVFRVRPNGALHRVGTFDSGGTQPVSLGLAGDHLYVANRGDVIQGSPGTIAPNYTAFNVRENGRLTAIPGSTVTLPIGLSPSQTLISRDGGFLFGDNFAIPGTNPPLAQTIDPFQIQADGTLRQAPGGPLGAAVTPNVLLGTTTHPTLPIIYAGLTGAKAVGVFTYGADGSLKFVGSSPQQGAAPCWVVVSADGKYLYDANTGTDSVGVFSLADPLHPVEI